MKISFVQAMHWLWDCSILEKNGKMTMMSQFDGMTSLSKIFIAVLFIFSSLFHGLNFMSISSLVLEL